MVEAGGGRAFPVVFFDGEREANVGEVKISPVMEYKLFRVMLGQKIGISPNQISIYLVDRKRSSKSRVSDRRRTPINRKVDFGLICRQRDCCFLVLKRSRKSRNRRERAMSGGVELGNLVTGSKHCLPSSSMHSVPENLILLRRNWQLSLYDEITQLNNSLQSLSIQTDSYHHQMAGAKGNLTLINCGWFDPQSLSNLSVTDTTTEIIYNWCKIPSTMITTNNDETKKAFCGECMNAEQNRSTTSFHHCINDAVISQFTTRMGPINRPNKSVSL